jgi:hypothetical protein
MPSKEMAQKEQNGRNLIDQEQETAFKGIMGDNPHRVSVLGAKIGSENARKEILNEDDVRFDYIRLVSEDGKPLPRGL